MKTYGNLFGSRALIALLVVLALVMFGVGVAVAQESDEEEGGAAGADAGETVEIEGVVLPAWASTLTFGALSLSLLVSAATEVTKRVLQLLGLYRDGWGRWIVGLWAFGFVALALATNLLDVGAVVNDRVAWLYQVMLLLLTLLGAPTAYAWAKATGLVENTTAVARYAEHDGLSSHF